MGAYQMAPRPRHYRVADLRMVPKPQRLRRTQNDPQPNTRITSMRHVDWRLRPKPSTQRYHPPQ